MTVGVHEAKIHCKTEQRRDDEEEQEQSAEFDGKRCSLASML